jgi:hypothetical protein
MTATAQPPALSAAQARKLVLAEVKAAKLRAELETAEAERDELRQRYKPRLQPSTETKDAGKNVLQAVAGKLLIRCTSFMSGEYFGLKDYREAGHPVTPEMEAFIQRYPRERWSWRDLRGPRRPDAVEPRD